MTKRILSFLMVLAMVLAVLPVQIVGAEQAEPVHSHSNSHQCSEQCPGGTYSWTPWGVTNGSGTSLPNASGHYYLECDITISAWVEIAAGLDITICLNGWNITETASATGNQRVHGKLTISDCTAYYDAEGNYISGKVTGCKQDDGGFMNVRRGGVLVLESGQFIGCTAKGGGGAVSLQAKNTTTAGGTFYMYGGEITGCSAVNGGAIVANTGAKMYLYGGKIHANAATGSGDNQGGGAIYLTDTSEAVIENVEIADNTAKKNKQNVTVPGIYVVGASSKLTVGGSTRIENIYFNNAANCLYVNGLEKDSQIAVFTVDPSKTAPELVKIAQNGAQAEWNSTWLTVNDQIVSLGEDGFVYGLIEPPVVHTHCQDGRTDCGHTQETWKAWDKSDSLPSKAGSYYLTGNVELSGSWTLSADIKLCLNGYAVKKVAGLTTRIIVIPVGTSLTLTNCQNAGAVTGGTGFNVHRGNATTAGGVLNIYGGKLTGFNASEGVVYMQSGKVNAPGGTFNLYGGEIVGNTAKTGGIVCVKGETAAASQGEPATFNLYGGRIADNEITELGGGVYTIGKAAVNILGGEISGNTTAGSGAGIYATEGATVTVQNAVISGNTAAGQAGGIFANKNSVVTVRDSAVENNTSTKDGGGAYLHTVSATISGTEFSGNTSIKSSGCGLGFGGAAVATITGCNISGNTGPNGAGMIVQGTSQVTLQNTKIADNHSTTHGGGIYINSGASVTMGSGCELTGNTAVQNGGGIYAVNNASLTLNGAQVKGNEASKGGGVYALAQAQVTLAGNVLIQGNQSGNLQFAGLLTVQDMTEGAAVQVTADPGQISNPCQDYSQYFTCDSPYQQVSYVDGTLYIGVADAYYHKHCLCASAADGCDHINQDWGVWDKTDSLPSSGCYYLLYDVVLTGEQSISGDLSLCLNGKTVTAAENKRIFSTPKNAEITVSIADCTGNGKLTGGVDVAKNTGGGAIFIRAKGTLNWYGGALTGNKSVTAGGAILLADYATFNMYGGEVSENGALEEGKFINGGALFGMTNSIVNIHGGKIVNNTGRNGGAMYVDGTLTITGGEISGNTASEQGGSIYAKTGDLTVSGGLIAHNSAVKDGGGLYYRQGNATISDGTVQGNSSMTSGGGVAFSGNAQVTMTGGAVTGNSSPNGGGMLVQGGATLDMQGGKITGNTSNGPAGGIYQSGGTAVISGGEISGNVSRTDGGGLYVRDSATAEITGNVLISGNKSIKGAGGGVCFTGRSTVKISGGLIEKNQAPNAGGLIAQGNVSVEITDVTVKNNTATKTGGGIYVNNSTLDFSGGKVTGNRADEGQGGGMFCAGTSDVTVTGGTFSYNTSYKDGAGIYNSKGILRLSGMTITGNQSEKGAGGGFGATKEGRVIMTGGSVTYNKAGNAAGVIIQSKAHLEMYGGTIAYNEGNQGAGLYVNNASANLQGGTIHGNTSRKNGGGGYMYNSRITMGPNFTVKKNESTNQYCGGLYFNMGTLDINGSKFVENKSKMGGSGFYTFKTEATVKDVYVADNVTTNSTGGGVVLSRETKFVWEGGIIENNYSSSGGAGILIQNWAEGTATGMIVRNNTAGVGGGGLFTYTCVDANFVDCEIYGNKTSTSGAGVFLSSPRGSFDPLSYINFTGCKIYDNESGELGGGVYISKQIVSTWTDCEIYNNTCGTQGGAMYTLAGSRTTLDNVRLTGNKSGQTGSGLYAGDNVKLKDVTITGNRAQEGAAVYIPSSLYDGESFQYAYYAMSGDIIIADNEGSQGDLFIDAGTAIGTVDGGFGKNTKITVELAEGILTNTILAEYDYEGGDLHYTITYGDRSTREPEYEAAVRDEVSTETPVTDKTETSGDIWLYTGIGILVLAIAAAAVLVLKKKKSKTPEANKE